MHYRLLKESRDGVPMVVANFYRKQWSRGNICDALFRFEKSGETESPAAAISYMNYGS